MKRLFLGLFCIFSIFLFGKEPIAITDSAYQFCLANPDDDNAIDQFRLSLNSIYSTMPETTFFYSSELLRLSEKNNLLSMKGRALVNMGICMEFQGQLDSAIYYYNLANETAEQTEDIDLKASVFNNLGIAYSYKGLYESSLEYALKALAIYEEVNNEGGMAMMYNNIGLRYSELANQDRAIEFYVKAIALNTELGNRNRLGINNNNLGRSYFIKGELDSASYFYKKALHILKERNNAYDQLKTFDGLAHIAIKKGELLKAQLYLDSLANLANTLGSNFDLNNTMYTQGVIYSENGKNEKALDYLLKYESWVEEAQYTSSKPQVYHAIANVYRKLGDLENSLIYMERFAFAIDTIQSEQKDLAMEQVSIYKQSKLEKEKEILNRELVIKETRINSEKSLRNTFVIIGFLLVLLVLGIGHRFFTERKIKRTLAEKNEIIQKEKDRSDSLLLNILPKQVAEELKIKGESDAKEFEEVTVIFTDFIQFTTLAEQLTARELVSELNHCFKAFDNLISTFNLEKVKTIGDSYMAASGLHLPRKAGAKEAVKAALAMQEFMVSRAEERKQAGKEAFAMRVGIHTGPVVAGIVGVKKFQYDIWGDTVNIASRMESSSEGGKVNISQSTFALIQNEPGFSFESRGLKTVKGKGELQMWFVNKA